jgi:uncharacterized protein YceK
MALGGENPMKQIYVVLLILAVSSATSGCGSSSTEQPSQKSPSTIAMNEKGKKAGEADAADAQVLTAEDRAAAEKQRICPVTDQLLGSMGDPYKLEVKNRTVFLCCEGCVVAIRQNPDKYLAKLKEPPAKK